MLSLVFQSFLLCFLLCSHTHANQPIIFQLTADVYSEPIPIDAFTDDWVYPYLKQGEAAFAQGKMELIQAHQKQTYRIFWQYDYWLTFTSDAAKLYYQYANDHIPEKKKYYDLGIRAVHLDMVGFRWDDQYLFTPSWSMTYGVSLLKAVHTIDGRFSGGALGQPAKNFKDYAQRINASLDYWYDQPALHEEELAWLPDVTDGLGFSTYVSISGQLSDQLKVQVQVDDIYGEIHWKDLARTQYHLNYDVDGRPLYQITGQLSQSRKIQRIPTSGLWKFEYQPWLTHPLQVTVGCQHNLSANLCQLGVSYAWAGYRIGALLEPTSSAVGVSIDGGWFELKYLADHLNTNQAHRMGMSLVAHYLW